MRRLLAALLVTVAGPLAYADGPQLFPHAVGITAGGTDTVALELRGWGDSIGYQVSLSAIARPNTCNGANYIDWYYGVGGSLLVSLFGDRLYTWDWVQTRLYAEFGGHHAAEGQQCGLGLSGNVFDPTVAVIAGAGFEITFFDRLTVSIAARQTASWQFVAAVVRTGIEAHSALQWRF